MSPQSVQAACFPQPLQTSMTVLCAREVSDADEVGEVYEVYDIVDRDVVDGVQVYRVQWSNYSTPDDDTWEPRIQLIEDGFHQLVLQMDAYVKWRQETREEGEVCSIADYRRAKKLPIRFANDVKSMCAIAAITTAAELLGQHYYVS